MVEIPSAKARGQGPRLPRPRVARESVAADAPAGDEIFPLSQPRAATLPPSQAQERGRSPGHLQPPEESRGSPHCPLSQQPREHPRSAIATQPRLGAVGPSTAPPVQAASQQREGRVTASHREARGGEERGASPELKGTSLTPTACIQGPRLARRARRKQADTTRPTRRSRTK